MRALLASLLLTTAAMAQPWEYDVALDSAYALARADDLEGAVRWYETAFRRAAPANPFVPFGAAQDAMRADAPQRAVSFLHLAAKTGFTSVLYAHRVSDLEPLRANTAVWEGWLDAIHRAQARLYPAYDEGFARAVIRLALEAERTANRRFNLEADSTLSSAERANRAAALDAVARATEQRAVALVSERGWPVRRAVGDAGSRSAQELVGRLSSEAVERLLPAYRSAIENGEADVDRYVEVVDQHRVAMRMPQQYGTASWRDDLTGEFVLYPLEDGVDARRAELGLRSLETWFGQIGWPWPPRTGWPKE